MKMIKSTNGDDGCAYGFRMVKGNDKVIGKGAGGGEAMVVRGVY